MKKNLLTVCVSIVIGLILTEVGLRLLRPIGDPLVEQKLTRSPVKYIESQFFPHEAYLFYPEEELPYMAERTRFTTNNMGFRGPHLAVTKPKNEIWLFMVGGSTTECLYLDDDATITANLEQYLAAACPDTMAIRVYNAGKGGDKTYDHVAMISQRIVHLEPDMIILFCGLNDLLAAMADVDYLHLPSDRRTAYSLLDLLAQLATELQIPRHVISLLSRGSDAELRQAIPFHSNYKNLAQLCRSYPLSDRPPRIDLAAYERNVRTIIGIARGHNIKLMLLTQPTTWNSRFDPRVSDWHWMNCSDGKRYREGDMDRAMEAYNDVTRRLAREFDIPVIDLARMFPKSLEVIYDDCHFNVNGAKTTALWISTKLIEDGILNLPAPGRGKGSQ